MMRTEGVIWSPEAEIDLLGAALYAPRQCEAAFERLTPDHFHDPVHGRLWEVITRLQSEGCALEPSVIAHRLGEDPGFTEWGGPKGLFSIMAKASPHAAPALTDVLTDLHIRRALENVARDALERVRDTSESSGEELLVEFERKAASIAQQTSFDSAWHRAGDMLAQALALAKARDGSIRYPVGIVDVDRKLGGLNAGETTAIAAWTGMGKTIAGLQIAKANGSKGKGVAYFSLEMTETPMAMRLACDLAFDRSAPAYSGSTSNITIDRAIAGRLEAHEWSRLESAQRAAVDWPIYFDTRPGLTVAQIEAATVRLHRDWAKQGIEPGPVIIDHIGKVRPTTDRKGSVTAETRDVANDLDAMAKRLQVPVVALSQINRLVETGASKDKRPTLSSIKDSGVLAENARQVIFIYRPEYYYRDPFEHEEPLAKAERHAELQKVRNHFYWIIEKNSNGPRAQVLSYCMADCSAVRDWTQ